MLLNSLAVMRALGQIVGEEVLPDLALERFKHLHLMAVIRPHPVRNQASNMNGLGTPLIHCCDRIRHLLRRRRAERSKFDRNNQMVADQQRGEVDP
ncbi:hypothetical protein BSY17_4145 (plasmid) [Sphingobium sp. RAC03]|nr:hypothetical protein BSY17_4145 [Sphingobium sp. RAC03]